MFLHILCKCLTKATPHFHSLRRCYWNFSSTQAQICLQFKHPLERLARDKHPIQVGSLQLPDCLQRDRGMNLINRHNKSQNVLLVICRIFLPKLAWSISGSGVFFLIVSNKLLFPQCSNRKENKLLLKTTSLELCLWIPQQFCLCHIW